MAGCAERQRFRHNAVVTSDMALPFGRYFAFEIADRFVVASKDVRGDLRGKGSAASESKSLTAAANLSS